MKIALPIPYYNFKEIMVLKMEGNDILNFLVRLHYLEDAAIELSNRINWLLSNTSDFKYRIETDFEKTNRVKKHDLYYDPNWYTVIEFETTEEFTQYKLSWH